MAYRYMWRQADGSPDHMNDEPTAWPPRGDWASARLRNPTLERTVEGETYDPDDWPSNSYLDLDRLVPTLAPKIRQEKIKLMAAELGVRPSTCDQCTPRGSGRLRRENSNAPDGYTDETCPQCLGIGMAYTGSPPAFPWRESELVREYDARQPR